MFVIGPVLRPIPRGFGRRHAKPGGREALRDLIVVVGIPRKRRQQNDGWT